MDPTANYQIARRLITEQLPKDQQPLVDKLIREVRWSCYRSIRALANDHAYNSNVTSYLALAQAARLIAPENVNA